MSPFISIVIPVYNAEHFLEESVRSILVQTYKNFEIILVNDGSTDQSLQICHMFDNQYENIHVVSQHNQGVTVARKKGVSTSKGDWIFFMDADDTIPVNCLSVLVNHCEDADVIIGSVNFDGPSKWPYPFRNRIMEGNEYAKNLLTRQIHSGPVAKLIKKDLFDTNTFDIPRKIICGEDFLMNLNIANKVHKVVQIEDVVYNYIFREGSAMSARPFSRLRYVLLFDYFVYKISKPGRNGIWKEFMFNITKRFHTYTKLNLKKSLFFFISQKKT